MPALVDKIVALDALRGWGARISYVVQQDVPRASEIGFGSYVFIHNSLLLDIHHTCIKCTNAFLQIVFNEVARWHKLTRSTGIECLRLYDIWKQVILNLVKLDDLTQPRFDHIDVRTKGDLL